MEKMIYSNGLFDDLFKINSVSERKAIDFVPLADVIEKDNKYIIDLIAPGMSKKDFEIKMDDGKLHISGTRNIPEETKYSIKESFFGKFEKSYKLPKDILIDKIGAKYADGILKISIPKDTEKVKSKLIEIN